MNRPERLSAHPHAVRRVVSLSTGTRLNRGLHHCWLLGSRSRRPLRRQQSDLPIDPSPSGGCSISPPVCEL